MKKTAEISKCGKYRYELSRRWGDKDGVVVWVMLNPSTADASVDDPPIRRCMKFTHRFGFEALKVVNLFAFRSSDPRKLKDESDPVGPGNEYRVLNALVEGSRVIVAWGALKLPMPTIMRRVIWGIEQDGHKLECLGKTKDGSPRHPLYLRNDAPVIPWSAASVGIGKGVRRKKVR